MPPVYGPWQSIDQIVRERLAQWTLTKIAYDSMNGVPFDPPEGAPWIRPTMIDLSRERGSMGENTLIEQRGIVETQLFFPESFAGAPFIDRVVNSYAALFHNYDAGTVEFLEPQRVVVGNAGTNDGYYQVNIRQAYIYLGHVPEGPVEDIEQMIFTQAAHGFAAGDVIYSGSTAWAKAQANSTATVARAIVVEVYGDQFIANSGGFVTISGHGFTQGSPLWLSTATAGSLSTTLPTGVVQECGQVVDANTLNIDFRIHTS